MDILDEIGAKKQFRNYSTNPIVVNGGIQGFYIEAEIFQAMKDVMDHYNQAPQELRLYLGRVIGTNALAMMVVGVKNQVEMTDHIASVTLTLAKTGPCPPNCDKASQIIN